MSGYPAVGSARLGSGAAATARPSSWGAGWRRRFPLLAGLGALLLCAACASPASAGAPPLARWLSWSASQRTVTLVLVAGYDDANNGFNFDGYGRGMLLVHVPLGWRVVVRCENAASSRHSCAIVDNPQTTAPAFPGAASPLPLLGLLSGQSARFSFTASRAGSYRITCLVPGDEQARMWDLLEVGGSGQPSISTRTGF